MIAFVSYITDKFASLLEILWWPKIFRNSKTITRLFLFFMSACLLKVKFASTATTDMYITAIMTIQKSKKVTAKNYQTHGYQTNQANQAGSILSNLSRLNLMSRPRPVNLLRPRLPNLSWPWLLTRKSMFSRKKIKEEMTPKKLILKIINDKWNRIAKNCYKLDTLFNFFNIINLIEEITPKMEKG